MKSRCFFNGLFGLADGDLRRTCVQRLIAKIAKNLEVVYSLK